MVEFTILKKSQLSKARYGVLKTPHGEVETPTLVNVATQAVVKTLHTEELKSVKSQLLICNTFHLHLKPGEAIVAQGGGLHEYANLPLPLMTDSAGYQVFSLGFGRDLGQGKILKEKSDITIADGQQPQRIKITEDGVWFRSPVDGQKLFIGPKESIEIQQKLGADIIFTFDECTSPVADYAYTKTSLERTNRWAKECLEAKTTNQSLWGIVQGGKFEDLRKEAAQYIAGLPFDGYCIGGEFGDDKSEMTKMLHWVNNELPENKPRHLLGIGYEEDFVPTMQSGVDTFDCIVPTHFARHGTAFTSESRLDMQKSQYLKEFEPLDKSCQCMVCQNYKRSYITHLIKAKEITGLKLLSFHNLYFFNSLAERLRNDIKNGML